MRRKLESHCTAALILLAAVNVSLAHECEQLKDFDDHSAVFLSAANKRPFPLVQVVEQQNPIAKYPLRTKLFTEDDCMVTNGRYNCCAIFRVTGLEIRETVCIDFASRNNGYITPANDIVEEFDTTLTVGDTHASMTHGVNIRAGGGDYLQNVTIPLCLPFIPMFQFCITIRNTTYNFETKTIRTCFSLDVGLQVLPGVTLFSLNLNCLKYSNKTIVKDPAEGYDNIVSRDPLGGFALSGEEANVRIPPNNALPIPSLEADAPDSYTGDMPPTILNHEVSSGEATTRRVSSASPQGRLNWSPNGPRRLVIREKRDIPKSPGKREYLPERNNIRNRVQRTRDFVNLYNFDRNWQHQFFI